MDNLASLMSEHVKTVSRIPEHVKNAFKGFRFTAACVTARSSEGGFSSVGGDDCVDNCSIWSSDWTQSITASYYTAIQDTSGCYQDCTFFSAPSTPQLFAPSSASTPMVSSPPRRQSILRRSSRKTGFRERSETQVLKKLVAPPAIVRKKQPSTTGNINEPKVFTSKIPCRIKLADISELSSMVTIVPKEAFKPSRIPQRIIQEQANSTPPPPPVATSSQNKSKSTRPPYSPWAVASVRPFKLRRRSSIHRARARQQKDEEDTTT